MSRRTLLACIAVVVVALIYFMFNPAVCGFFPKCSFYVLTGFKCPGCGSQRAIHSLLHLDVVSAVKYNFMLVFSIPFVLLLGYAEIRRVSNPGFYAKVNNQTSILAAFFLVVGWWIFRNIFDF